MNRVISEAVGGKFWLPYFRSKITWILFVLFSLVHTHTHFHSKKVGESWCQRGVIIACLTNLLCCIVGTKIREKNLLTPVICTIFNMPQSQFTTIQIFKSLTIGISTQDTISKNEKDWLHVQFQIPPLLMTCDNSVTVNMC